MVQRKRTYGTLSRMKRKTDEKERRDENLSGKEKVDSPSFNVSFDVKRSSFSFFFLNNTKRKKGERIKTFFFFILLPCNLDSTAMG